MKIKIGALPQHSEQMHTLSLLIKFTMSAPVKCKQWRLQGIQSMQAS